MNSTQTKTTKRIGTLLAIGLLYAGSVAAVYCPPGEMPATKGVMSSCIPNTEAKPQLDIEKYVGAQKDEAASCNTINIATKAVDDSSKEIARIDATLDEAQFAVKKATGAEHDALVAKVAEWKDKRKAEMEKLSQAQKDLTAAKKDNRNALKLEKKEGSKPLSCV